MKTASNMADGQGTTVFIPTDLVGVTNGIASTLGIGKPIAGAISGNKPVAQPVKQQPIS